MESPFAVTEWFCCFLILLFIFDRVLNFRNVLDRRFCLFRHLATTSEEPFREFRSSTWCTISVFDHDILYIAKRDLHLKKAKSFRSIFFIFFYLVVWRSLVIWLKRKTAVSDCCFIFFNYFNFLASLEARIWLPAKLWQERKWNFVN